MSERTEMLTTGLHNCIRLLEPGHLRQHRPQTEHLLLLTFGLTALHAMGFQNESTESVVLHFQYHIRHEMVTGYMIYWVWL